MHLPRSASRLLIGFLLVAPLFESGCGLSWPWRKMPLDASAGFYESATLRYRLDAGKAQLPLDVTHVEGQRLSYDQLASSPLAEQSLGTLEVTYPHPTKGSAFGRVTFTLDSGEKPPSKRVSWNPFAKQDHVAPRALEVVQAEAHELWSLDLPRAECDAYFKALSNQNFYNTDRDSKAPVQLAVTINGNHVQKHWDQVPELNALVQRVRREGQLLSYNRRDLQAGKPLQAISSTQAYSELLVASGTVPAPPANAFSMAPLVSPQMDQPQPQLAPAQPQGGQPAAQMAQRGR